MKTKIFTFIIASVMVLTMLFIPGMSAFADSPPTIGSLDAPQNVKVEIKEWEDGRPYFEVKWTNPASILEVVQYWDDIRLEAQKDKEPVLLFEYAKNSGGYAAQYYFMAVTGRDFSGAKEQMCVYRTIFDGQNGSCARFDGIDAEPETLLGGVPRRKISSAELLTGSPLPMENLKGA